MSTKAGKCQTLRGKKIQRYGEALFQVALYLLPVVCLLISAPACACANINGITDTNCDGAIVIVCFGDSITYGDNVETWEAYPVRLDARLGPAVTVVNAGLNGENTVDGATRLPTVLAANPTADYVLIMEGANDYLVGGSTPADTYTRLGNMAATVTAASMTPILLQVTEAVSPQVADRIIYMNTLAAETFDVATRTGFVTGTMLLADGIHPNARGHEWIANKAASALAVTVSGIAGISRATNLSSLTN